MKSLPTAASTALAAANVRIGAAIRLAFGTTHRLWTGYGDLTVASETYSGIGALAISPAIGAAIGAGAEGISIALSAIDPTIAATIEAEDYHQKTATLRRLVFDAANGALLGDAIFFRGRVDQVSIEEEPGGTATLTLAIEGGRRDFSRGGARRRADADQRLISATDGAFKHTATTAERTLYWGNKAPATAERNPSQVAADYLRQTLFSSS